MQDILEKVLPTKQSIWIAGITMTLAINAWLLQSWLQKIGIQIDLLSKIEIRLLLAVSVLCVGLFALLVSITKSYTNKDKSHKQEIESLYQSFGLKEERKLRVKRWKDEIQVCESLQDFHNTTAFLEIEPLLNSEERNEIAVVHKDGNAIIICTGIESNVSTPLSRLLVCYRKAIYRLEGLWGLI